MVEKIDNFNENFTEKINSSSEKIGSQIEKIGDGTEKIAEKIPEKIRYKGQRGADRHPRMIHLNSLRNLKQYRNVHIETSDDSGKWIWYALIALGIIVLFIVLLKIYQRRKEKQESQKDEELDY